MSYSIRVSDGDLDFAQSTGKPQTVEGWYKLSQDVAEALLTEYDPSRDFGSELMSKDTQLVPSQAIAVGEVTRMVSEALDRLQNTQRMQNNLAYEEEMSHIGNLLVIPQQSSGGVDVFFYVQVVPKDGETIEKLMQVGNGPEPVKLAQMLPNRYASNIDTNAGSLS